MIVSEPSINVEGIFQAPFYEDELREQIRSYYFPGNLIRDVDRPVQEFLQNHIPLVLFEVTLKNLDDQFRLDHFTQEMPNAPERAWQVPHGEALLSRDGSRVVARGITCTRGLRNGRVTFYFHFYDPLRPMRWSYGVFKGPEVQPIPQRLSTLIPYESPH